MSDEPEDLTRSDLRDIRAALRQDWGAPADVKRKILQRLIDYLDRDCEEGQTASDRTVLMAARTFVDFMRLNIDQQSIDVQRDKLDGRKTNQVPLADLVQEAERRAEERIRGRAAEDSSAAGV